MLVFSVLEKLKLSTSASTLRTWESQVEILKLSTSARLVVWGLEMLDQVCCRVLQVCPAPDTGLLVRWHHLHKGAYGTTDHGAGCPLQIKSNVRLTRDTTLRLTPPWLKCKSPTDDNDKSLPHLRDLLPFCPSCQLGGLWPLVKWPPAQEHTPALDTWAGIL